jgi:hypothetical protein
VTWAGRSEKRPIPQSSAERLHRPAPEGTVGRHVRTLRDPQDDRLTGRDAEIPGENLVDRHLIAADSRGLGIEAERGGLIAG